METRNRVWTTVNNGFFADQQHQQQLQRPQTPGNLSTLTAFSGRQSAQTHGLNDGNSATVIKHPPYNPNLIGVQSKFRRKYYHKAVLGTLLLLIIIFLIVIIVLSVTYNHENTTCRSKECVRTAASLIYSMDEQTDPCEDFYQFTCGNWGDEHPRSDSATSNDWFRIQQANIMLKLRKFLQKNITDSEPESVSKTKAMYKSCTNTEALEKRKYEPLAFYLNEFKLPLVPGSLNVTVKANATKYLENSNKTFDWLHSLVLIKKTLGMDLIFGFDIFADPFNKTINRIALGTPETDTALPFNNDDIHRLMKKVKKKTMIEANDIEIVESHENEEDDEVKNDHTANALSAYLAYIKELMKFFFLYLNPELNFDNINDNATQLLQDAVKVAKTIYKLKDEAENSTKTSKNPMEDIVYITINDLQNQTDKLIAPKSMPIWQKYLEMIMKDANQTQKFDVNSLKIVTSPADILYIQTVVEYLDGIPTTHIEYYLWLSIVEEMMLHTTNEVRALHADYMREVIGTEGAQTRSMYCTHSVNTLMGMALSYALADEKFIKYKLPHVKRMLSDIRKSFEKLVSATHWMDEQTKRATLKKSAEMKSLIGFPKWITNATALNAHYEGVHVNESTHLENMVGVLSWQMQMKLNDFFVPEKFGWATSPSNVNAFHTFQSNTITVPIAILQYPFYDLGLEALNYGSIGTILGHELTHGFDDSGRMFDKNGNMIQWWSNETINEYVNRTECFVDQYSHYYLSDIGEYIDGELTLGENIADNGGMREAFNAYNLYTRDVGREKLQLPGLEHYTHEQLFFISFGNLWCETYTAAASRYALEDSHCPGKIRLKGVLSNSNEFAKAFKCAKGSGMNPKEPKCKIW